MMKGSIIRKRDEGYGFIKPEEGEKDVFFHASSVVDITFDDLKEGDTVEAKFTGVDRKNRTISLSIKAKDYDEEKAAIATYSSDAASAGTTAFGDLLKDQLNANKD